MYPQILTTLLIIASLLNAHPSAQACSPEKPFEQTMAIFNHYEHLITGTIIHVDLDNPIHYENYKLTVVITQVLKGNLKKNDTIEVYQNYMCSAPPAYTPAPMYAFLSKSKHFWTAFSASFQYPRLTAKPVENPTEPRDIYRNAAQKLLQQVIHQTGYIKHYYLNGNLEAEGYIANGLPQGLWKYFNKDGQLIEQGNYNENGAKIGTWETLYYEKSKKTKKEDSLFIRGFRVYEKEYRECEYPYKETYSLYPNGDFAGRTIYTLLKPSTVYGELDFYNENHISFSHEKDTLHYGYKRYDDSLHSQTSYNVQYYPNYKREKVTFKYDNFAKKMDSYGYKYAYNQQGILIEKIEWIHKLNGERVSYIYAYNDKGILINKRDVSEHPNGDYIKHIYEYNDQGVLINEKETIENDKQKK